MKTIIAGSRTFEDFLLIDRAVVESGFEITEVVSGNARGIDRLGEQWALNNGLPITRFIADWDTHGKKAGFIRNESMAQYAEALIAITTGSPGTSDMIRRAENHNLKIYILYIP